MKLTCLCLIQTSSLMMGPLRNHLSSRHRHQQHRRAAQLPCLKSTRRIRAKRVADLLNKAKPWLMGHDQLPVKVNFRNQFICCSSQGKEKKIGLMMQLTSSCNPIILHQWILLLFSCRGNAAIEKKADSMFKHQAYYFWYFSLPSPSLANVLKIQNRYFQLLTMINYYANYFNIPQNVQISLWKSSILMIKNAISSLQL